MSEIFINYRTGDAEQTAAAIDADLSHRFGSDSVFYAGKSIGGGTPFPARILQAVSTSKVLVALMGEHWLDRDSNGLRRLDDSKDWVRRELVAALDNGVTVIPVLVGRRMELISAADLPRRLRGLADIGYRRYDHRNARNDLTELSREIVRLVPSLVDRTISVPDTSQKPEGGNSVTGTTVSGNGTLFQGGGHYENNQRGGIGSVAGNVGTFVNESHAPMHTGHGDQYNVSGPGGAR